MQVDELSALITDENGKIASEARAEILKAIELTEFACSLPQIASGEVFEVSRGVECRLERADGRGRVDHAIQLSGWNESRFGVGDITGRGSIEFCTQSRKMTTKWNREAGHDRMS